MSYFRKTRPLIWVWSYTRESCKLIYSYCQISKTIFLFSQLDTGDVYLHAALFKTRQCLLLDFVIECHYLEPPPWIRKKSILSSSLLMRKNIFFLFYELVILKIRNASSKCPVAEQGNNPYFFYIFHSRLTLLVEFGKYCWK